MSTDQGLLRGFVRPMWPATGRWTAARALLLRVLREALIVTALLGLYKLARLIAVGEQIPALRHAEDIWHIERWLRLPDERSFQTLVIGVEPVVKISNLYYKWAHFGLTSVVLLVLFVRDSGRGYRLCRDALGLVTLAGLLVHLLVPTAPPRLLPSLGMIDTGRVFGPAVYGDLANPLVNQFAAMPSLHVGWAIIVAVALIAAGPSRWRWLWLLHPLVTLLVVVITANHFWLDSVVGATLAAGALLGAARTGRPRREPTMDSSAAEQLVP